MDTMITCKLLALFLTASLNLITCQITPPLSLGNNITQCDTRIRNLNNEVVNIESYCKLKPCIAKCCPWGEILSVPVRSGKRKCIKIDKPSAVDYNTFGIYENDIEKRIVRTNKTILNDFNLVQSRKFDINDPKSSCTVPRINWRKTNYILENSMVKLEMPNHFERWIDGRDQLEYCIDIVKVTRKNVDEYTPGFIMLTKIRQTQTIKDNINILTEFSKYTRLISCFFLLLVLLVYCLLRKLRNISGMVLMAYVTSLIVSLILKSFQEFLYESFTLRVCRIVAPIIYCMFLSSFFWLNILSFDIWWTFRGTKKHQAIHRRGETVKFMWYCLYACGTPVLLAIAAVLIDISDLSHWPAFIKPLFYTCFVSKYETILYLYVPMFIIILSNCVLFIMTIYNICVVERNIKAFNTKEGETNMTINRNRFRIYMTLSMLMGVNWLLELCYMIKDSPNNIALTISMELYNSLIGVVIFFLFVFKKKTLTMFRERYCKNKYRIRSDQLSTNCSKYSTNSKKMGSVKSTNNDSI